MVAVDITTTILKLRAPGMSLRQHAAVRVGVARHVGDDHLRDADGDAGRQPRAVRPHARARISSIPPRAATRCSGSTCSGSSDIRRSTSSSFRRWDSSRPIIPDVRAAPDVRPRRDRAVADRHRLPVVRAVGASHVRDQRAGARQELLHGDELHDRDSHGAADLLLDRDAVDRPARTCGRRCCSCSASSSSC